MDRMVVDASVAVAWVHPGQATPQTDALLTEIENGATVLVPSLWPVEVANALLVLERRGKLTSTERHAALAGLHELSFEVDDAMAGLAFTRLSQLATEQALTLYDAVYLELALRLKLPLACRDGPLREAAKRRGVAVLT